MNMKQGGIPSAIFVVLAVASGLQYGYSQTPVPARPQGFTILSSETPKVVVEAFYDHLCIDSKSNWPILEQVLKSYVGKDVSAIVHIFPLPYHHNAFFAQRAGVMVRRIDPMQFQAYSELIFAHQDAFLSGAVNMTEPQVQDSIATLVGANLQITKAQILSAFSDTTVDQASRYAWKYAASRGVTGTAQFIVNGVHVPDAPEYTVAEWTKFIDTLLVSPFDKNEL